MTPPAKSTLRTLRRKLNTASKLSLPDWKHFVQAWGMLLFVDAWLRTGSFKKLQDFFDARSKTISREALTQEDESKTRDIVNRQAWIVSAAARFHLVQMSCLRRALVLQQLLRGEGIQTQLKFGVRTQGEVLQAHAWLERDGILVSEPELVRERYATLKEIGRVYENKA